jgi:hypothetical protein
MQEVLLENPAAKKLNGLAEFVSLFYFPDLICQREAYRLTEKVRKLLEM